MLLSVHNWPRNRQSEGMIATTACVNKVRKFECTLINASVPSIASFCLFYSTTQGPRSSYVEIRLYFEDYMKLVNEIIAINQGCQIGIFNAKFYNLGVFWSSLEFRNCI